MSEWQAVTRHRGGEATALVVSISTLDDTSTMQEATQRSILRWIHFIFIIPIIGYVYSPFIELPNYAPKVRFVAVPVLVLAGLWMWIGRRFRRRVTSTSV